MIRSRATLLATATALVAIVAGGIAAANADTGASGASGTIGASTTSGNTGATGVTNTTGATGTTGAAATITVNGAGFATIDPNAPAATVQAAYLDALESAVTDAHRKAAAVAAAVGNTLGTVQNITEQTNDSDGCTGPVMYRASGAAKHRPATGMPSRRARGHRKSRKATARIADAATNACTLEADVTLTYAMSAS
jgi:hypothetical protein